MIGEAASSGPEQRDPVTTVIDARDLGHAYRHFRNFKAHRRLLTRPEGLYDLREFVRQKAIHVHIPKAAGSSVNKALFGGLAGGHRTVAQYKTILGPHRFRRYFSFAFSRNPTDRLCSAFYFLKSGGMNDADREWATRNLAGVDDIDGFVLEWLDEERIWTYHHLRPQYHFICDLYPRIELDFLGSFENLGSDFLHVANKLKSNACLAHENKTRSAMTRRPPSPEAVAKIRQLYARDFAILPYD